MTKKTNHDHYKAERDKQDALRDKAKKSLTTDQLNAIKETHKTISHCLTMIRECNDLYMSDIAKLEDSFWQLKHQFNLENSHE
jgi:hypothetical protein